MDLIVLNERRVRSLAEAAAWVEAGGTVDLTAPSPTLTWDLVRAIERLSRADPSWERFTMSSDGGGSMPRFDEHGRLVDYAAGEVKALWESARRLIQEGFPLENVLKLVTVNPARILGIAESKGRIMVGNDGDFVILNDDLNIAATISNGNVIYIVESLNKSL